MNALGAAVIGLRMGRAHAEGYQRCPRAQLRAICDTEPGTVADVAAQLGVKRATADWRELVGDPEIQVVSIATPDPLHAEQCEAFLGAGQHVLCEKPLAVTVEDCDRIVAAAEGSKAKFMVGQVCRQAPGFVMAKALVDEGAVGRLFFAESEYAHDYAQVGGVGGWRKDPRHPRPGIVGGGCHAVDLLRWVAGEIEEVFAYSNHRVLTDWPVDDCTIACLKFANGVVGKVFCSIGCKRPYTMRTCLYGDQGTIICDNTSPKLQWYSPKLGMTGFSEIPVNVASHNVSREIEEFVQAIVEDKPVACDAREGARTVAACLAAVQSSATGRPVRVGKY